ncbi:MAG: glutathione S-transferase family protein [Actinomycetota bacterium]
MTAPATPPTVSLYGHWICPYVSRVAFALAERDIPYDEVDVPPSGVRPEGFTLPPEFLEHSPRREIPMVRVGGEYLADSIPILLWLEDRFAERPLLPPAGPDREHVIDRMSWLDERLFGPMVGVYYGTEPGRIDRAAAALASALDELDGWLTDRPWSGGEHPTLAEAVMVPLYVRLDGLRRLGFEQPLPVRVDEHRRRTAELDGWPAVAWSTDQTDELVGRFTEYRRRALA